VVALTDATEGTNLYLQISEPFVAFVIFVVKEIKVIVPGYPYET